jgi:hypothetical protein
MNPSSLGFRWIRSVVWLVLFKLLLNWFVATRDPDGWMFLALSAFVLALGRWIAFTCHIFHRWSRS